MKVANLDAPVCIADGKKVTNLSYIDSLELFNEAHETDNPCSILAPGYGSSENVSGREFLSKRSPFRLRQVDQ